MSPAEILKYIQEISHEEFVLHGSQYFFESRVKPHQAFTPGGNSLNNQHAIYARMLPHVALLHAIVRAKGNPADSAIGWKIQQDHIYVYGRNIVFKPGYIYVLPRKLFEVHRGGLVCVAYAPVRADRIIPVEPEILKIIPDLKFDRNLRL